MSAIPDSAIASSALQIKNHVTSLVIECNSKEDYLEKIQPLLDNPKTFLKKQLLQYSHDLWKSKTKSKKQLYYQALIQDDKMLVLQGYIKRLLKLTRLDKKTKAEIFSSLSKKFTTMDKMWEKVLKESVKIDIDNEKINLLSFNLSYLLELYNQIPSPEIKDILEDKIDNIINAIFEESKRADQNYGYHRLAEKKFIYKVQGTTVQLNPKEDLSNDDVAMIENHPDITEILQTNFIDYKAFLHKQPDPNPIPKEEFEKILQDMLDVNGDPFLKAAKILAIKIACKFASAQKSRDFLTKPYQLQELGIAELFHPTPGAKLDDITAKMMAYSLINNESYKGDLQGLNDCVLLDRELDTDLISGIKIIQKHIAQKPLSWISYIQQPQDKQSVQKPLSWISYIQQPQDKQSVQQPEPQNFSWEQKVQDKEEIKKSI